MENSVASKEGPLTSEEISNMWNLIKIASNLGTQEQCIKFAEACGLISRTKMCPKHRKPMYFSNTGFMGSFQCRGSSCRHKSQISMARGTWFENSKLPLPIIFYLMYCYAHHWPLEMVRLENFMTGPSLSSCTIWLWYVHCRDVVVRYYIETQDNVGKIGGKGKKVQVDKIEFVKSEATKKSLQGKWVLGIIEDDSDDLRLETCCDTESPEDVLLTLIKKHVYEGTVIRTEFFELEHILEENGYLVQAVNYEKEDKKYLVKLRKMDDDSRVSKSFYYKDNCNNPQNYAEMIVEFAWRKAVARRRTDPFIELIEAVKHSYGV